MNNNDSQKRLAVLIDADNAQASVIQGLMEEIANYGRASIKRIYGDWTNPNLKSWKEVLNEYSIQPIQQFGYTTGKNSTDTALIIDAMDILYAGNLDGFCIVSSDSDYTRLCARIRESGLQVYGFGEKKTPKAFVAACDKFIYIEILRKKLIDGVDSDSEVREQEGGPRPAREMRQDSRLVNLLRNTCEDAADENGWAHLATVGQNLANKSSEFDPRNYGYKKLGDLIRAIGLFEINEVNVQNGPGKSIFIRDKRKARA
ncbi:NYN domain-containing protein [Spirochaeta dissipatitropha]